MKGLQKRKQGVCILICAGSLALFGGCEQSSAQETRVVLEDEYIRTMPEVKAKMLSAQYWIDNSKNANQIIMTTDEIQKSNQEILDTLGYDEKMAVDIWKYPESITKEHLLEKIKPDKLKPEDTKLYLDGVEVEDEYYDKLKENYNLDSIEQEKPVQYAIVTSNADFRSRPTDDPLREEDSPYSDYFQYAVVPINEPVIVLHESTDQKWCYVQSYFGADWMHTDQLAFCDDYKTWEEAQDIENFLTVTGASVQLQYEQTNSSEEPLTLYMGDKIEVVPESEAPSIVDQRQYYDNYVVKVPVRDANGKLTYEYKLIPVSYDVTVGELLYTKENVLKQAFKCLGSIYGWGDMYNSYDCSGFTRTVYRCFGFQFVRNSGWQAQMPFENIDLSEMTEEEKKNTLNKLEPGSLLQFPEHIVMYLGHLDSKYYVISACGTYLDSNTEELVDTRTLMVNEIISTTRGNGNSWFSEFTTALTVK